MSSNVFTTHPDGRVTFISETGEERELFPAPDPNRPPPLPPRYVVGVGLVWP